MPLFVAATHVAEFTRERDRRLVIIDTAMPRNVDPAVCELPGVTLQNIDQLNDFVQRNAKQQHNLVVQAEKILRREAAGFLKQVTSEQVNPMVAKFRSQLGRVCSEEMERLNEEYGPFTQEQYEVLNALAENLMQRISGSISRTLADQADAEQETISNLLRGMFQVEGVLNASAAAAGQGVSQEEQILPCAASVEET